jgi:hypothetical protein
MKKLSAVFILTAFLIADGQAQETKQSGKQKPKWSDVKLTRRANDHIMIQYGYDGWAVSPDTLNPTGFNRHLNAYAMIDILFKTDPRWSVAIGAGVASHKMNFENTGIDIVNRNGRGQATFTDLEGQQRFKKSQVNAVWLEAPVELRYLFNPMNSNKSWKIAVGAKVGYAMAGYVKNKDFVDANGQSLYGSKYQMKEKSKLYYNNTRLAGTLRFGYGNFTAYGAYQVTGLFKEGAGPKINIWSAGLCISGL